jgi:hypothetical protein
MFENMSEFVGYAMHDDLMLRAKRDARATGVVPVVSWHCMWWESCREAVARLLVMLATRIAPSSGGASPGTRVLAQ